MRTTFRALALTLVALLLFADLAPALSFGVGGLENRLADERIESDGKSGSGESAAAAPTAAAMTGIVTASNLNVRAGVWGEILGTVKNGTQLEVIGKKNGWYQVKTPSGGVGWVSGKYFNTSGGSTGSGSTGSVSTGTSSGSATTLPTGEVKPGTGRSLRVKTTGYYPPPPGGYKSRAEARMEGGALDCRGKPLRTLQDYKPGSYVSVATDPRVIRTGTYFTIDQYPGIRFLACDVGGGIKGNHIDICVKDKAASYRVTGSATIRYL